VIGKKLNIPVVSKSPEEAANHFTWFTTFAGLDCPASSKLTQERLGWRPVQPSLLADLSRGAISRYDSVNWTPNLDPKETGLPMSASPGADLKTGTAMRIREWPLTGRQICALTGRSWPILGCSKPAGRIRRLRGVDAARSTPARNLSGSGVDRITTGQAACL
jgi:hypothetical protein